MNIDRDLAARALVKIGEQPVTPAEWEDGTSVRVTTIKDFYLSTFLESVSSYNWTSLKKRARLEALNDGVEDNLTEFKYMYPLPADCAKVVQINDGKPYIVEGAFLFTDVEDAVLLYIRNYFTGKYEFAKVDNPVAEDIDKYYVIDGGEYVKAQTPFSSYTDYYVIVENDYNFYAQPVLDPVFSSYFETKLAACLALKLSGGSDKYQMLYNEAEIIANKAMKKSAEQARNRTKGNQWWTDQLGLTSGGNACL